MSLALGIGANTALFNAMNGLLFRKLPVSDPDALVRFRAAGPNQMRTDWPSRGAIRRWTLRRRLTGYRSIFVSAGRS